MDQRFRLDEFVLILTHFIDGLLLDQMIDQDPEQTMFA
jgi:hypothetical protein